MNKFYKISLEQYLKDRNSTDINEELKNEWEDIKIPCVATKNSAGHDFYAPFDFELSQNETIKIPTGIKVELDEDKVLLIAPRSSLGFKYRLQLDNTIGVVDSDYYNNADNEGHIFVKITNDTNVPNKTLKIKKGEAFAQGIIVQFFKAENNEVNIIRKGGIGSTNE
jgi:dUTP pyrophosphatase